MKLRIIKLVILSASFFLFLYRSIEAQETNLSGAYILVSPDIKSPVNETCIKVLQEEIKKRTSIKLKTGDKWKSGKTAIALCLESSKDLYGKTIPQRNGVDLAEEREEGYRIYYDNKGTLWIIGADERGVLFGIGKLLRTARMRKNKILINASLDFATSPEYAIRGHQLGYRNTANSYDAWTIDQYDQYIRELMIFGTNAIENIPLGGKGDESVLMKISRKEMNVEISKICQAYDLDYWVWIPATIDLSDKELRVKELEKHEEFYRETPSLINS